VLKVLEAIEFNKVFTKGGRTEPWLIQVIVEGERKPYVVKLFKSDEIDNEHTVAREVFGTALAMEFDLSIPEPALVNFSPAFINTLPEEVREIIYFRDERLKFGSEYCENTTLLKPDLPSQQINKFIHDLPIIYAFDTLINNKDRGEYKTNILVSTVSEDYYIFDHERAFKNIKKLESELAGNTFSETLTNHVLKKYLHNKKDKSRLFDTFHNYLRILNVNVLDDYNNELRKHNLHSSELIHLKSYLYTVKQKADWFVKLLEHSISI